MTTRGVLTRPASMASFKPKSEMTHSNSDDSVLVLPEGSTRTISPGFTDPLAICPAKPRKSRLGRFTHCTGRRNGLA